jgi:hypothetical protein
MRELVLMCAVAMLGAGCVEVVPHVDEYDAGTPDVKPSDASGEPEASIGQCTSGKVWTGGNTPSPNHYPGTSCMGSSCHTSSSKTAITIGGTIYPLKGEHDDDNCNGLDSSMTPAAIAILDDSGMNELIPRLQINTVGNFFTTSKALPSSFRVKVISQGREAVMKDPVTNGDCNYCHRKEDFQMTKGRIVPAAP